MSDRRFDVFLSHNSKDKPAVLAIARALQQAGVEPWLDAWYLRGGDRWQHVLRDALQSSTACAFCYGAHGAGDWHELELEVAHDRALKDPNFRLIPVLLPGLPEPFEPTSLPLFLSTLMWVDLRQGVEDAARLEEFVVAVTGMPTSPNGRVVAAEVSDVSPYRGLHTFDREHAEFFFGREADVQRLLEKLKASRFLAVVGPSGSGKSSLVRAGLLPALERNGLPGSAAWQVCVLKPGTHPLETLALHLAQLGAPGSVQQIIDQLRESDRALHQVTSLALLGRPDNVRVLWVIDQAEEVFTLCQDEDERAAFLSNLLYAASAPEGRGAVVLTLRADFYPRLADYPRLAQRLGTDQYLVSPLEGQALRDAIEKPAARAGATFEPGVVDTILTDVETQPGAQPLLEHALQELWQRRRGRTLTLAAYQAIGGVAGALAKSADETFAHLTPEQQAIARRALLRLTQPGEGTEDTRRRAELDELAARPEEQGEVQRVVDALVTARLLTTSGDEQTGAQWVDVAHEALIRGWPRLREWLKEDREYLVMHRRLTEAAHDWHHGGRDTDLLYRGVRLAEAQALAEAHPDALNPLEREFVAESEAFRDRERLARDRLRKKIIAGSLLAAMVALAFAAFAGWQWWEAGRQKTIAESQSLAAVAAEATAVAASTRAEEEKARAEAETLAAEAARGEAEREARVALSRQLGAQSRALTEDIDLGLLLAAEAYDLNPDDGQVRRDLLAAVQAQPDLKTILYGNGAVVNELAYSPDGRWLASGSRDGTLRLWPEDGGNTRVIETGHSSVAGLAFRPDGRRLATAGGDETIRFWEPATGAEVGPRIATDRGRVQVLAYSPDGAVLASTGTDGAIELWDPETGMPTSAALTGHTDTVLCLDFSPDGKTLVSGAYDSVRFWNVADPAAPSEAEAPLFTEQSGVNCAALSPDGTILATAGRDGTVRLWDRRSRLPIGAPLTATAAELTNLAFSPDGATLTAIGADSRIHRWLVAPRWLTGQATVAGQGALLGLALHPDGSTIATGGSDGTVRLWRTTAPFEGPLLPSIGHGSAQSALAVSPDGQTIASGDEDGLVVLWDAATGTQIGPQLLGHSGRVLALDFSRDGATLASASSDGTIRLWDLANGPSIRATLLGHSGSVFDVEFSPSGDLIASGADDGVRLWRASDGAAGEPLSMPYVSALAFDPAGATLVIADQTGAVRRWDLDSRTLREPAIATGQGAVWAVRFIQGGEIVASAGDDGTILYWDAGDGSRAGEAPVVHDGAAIGLATNDDGSMLASIGADAKVYLWTVGGAASSEVTSTGRGWDLAFGPDDRLTLLDADDEGQNVIRIWDAAQAASVRMFPVQSILNRVVLSPDRRRVVTIGRDDRIQLLDLLTGTVVAEQRTPGEGGIWSVAFSPDGSRLASGSADGTIRLWDGATLDALTRPMRGHDDTVSALAFSPDGAQLASGSPDGTVRLWDAISGTPAAGRAVYEDFVDPDLRWRLEGQPFAVTALAFNSDQTLLGVTGNLTVLLDIDGDATEEHRSLLHVASGQTIAFSPDGKSIAVGSLEGFQIWSTETLRSVAGPIPQEGGTWRIGFSPDSRLLAALDQAGGIRVWDTVARTTLGDLRPETGATSVVFAPDSASLVFVDFYGVVSDWDLSPASWRTRVCEMANRNLTRSEWTEYLGEKRRNEPTCPELPLPSDAAATPVAAA